MQPHLKFPGRLWLTGKPRPRSLLAATQGYIGAMTVAPNKTRQNQIDELIRSLQANGSWDKLESLWLLASHDEQSAMQCVKKRTMGLTKTGTPVFVANRGIRGSDVDFYTTPGLLDNNTITLNRDNCHFGAWVAEAGTTTVSTGGIFGRSTLYRINAPLDVNPVGVLGGVSIDSSLTAPRVSHRSFSRVSGTQAEVYINGSLDHVTANATSGAYTNSTIFVGQASASNYANDRLTAVHYGRGLTALEAAGLYTALNTYLTAIGAI
jgi:hypothetical protein